MVSELVERRPPIRVEGKESDGKPPVGAEIREKAFKEANKEQAHGRGAQRGGRLEPSA